MSSNRQLPEFPDAAGRAGAAVATAVAADDGDPAAGKWARSWRGPLGFWLACLVAAAWSGFLLTSYANGAAARLLAADFVHYPFIAGLLLFVLAAHGLLSGPRTLGQGHGGAFEELIEPGRAHPMTWLGAVILLIPLIVAATRQQDTLSLAAVQRRGMGPQGAVGGLSMPLDFNAETLEHQFPPDAQGDRALTLLDLVGASGDEGLRAAFTGEPVVVEGQLAPWPEAHGDPTGRRLLYQLMMACCAADSVPLTAELRLEGLESGGDAAAGPADGDWARVRATAGFVQDEVSGYWRPLLTLKSLEAAAPPADPFLQR